MGARVETLMRELSAAIREEIGALPAGAGSLGEEVERARAAGRLSLQDVADGSGLTKSHVWEIAKGRSRNPTIAAVAGLSRALGVPFLRLAQAALNSTASPPEENGADDGAERVHAPETLSEPKNSISTPREGEAG